MSWLQAFIIDRGQKMKEFEKWLKLTQDGWVKDINGRTWPSFGCLNTNDEAECAEMGWRAALKMVQDWYKDAREGFDLGLWDMIKEELNGKT